MLLHQSLKSIHYRTLLIFQNKKQQILGSNMGGGDKKHVIPPMSKHGGHTSPPSPQDLRPCSTLPEKISTPPKKISISPVKISTPPKKNLNSSRKNLNPPP